MDRQNTYGRDYGISGITRAPDNFTMKGFTLIELIMVILILGILGISAVVKWPTGMDDTAAVGEFKRAVRYSQHLAMTRAFTGIGTAWGITISNNRYTVQRRGTDCSTCAASGCAVDFCRRYLLDDSSMSLSAGEIWFNGLGEPFDAGLAAMPDTVFSIAGSSTVTVYGETGYVE